MGKRAGNVWVGLIVAIIVLSVTITAWANATTPSPQLFAHTLSDNAAATPAGTTQQQDGSSVTVYLPFIQSAGNPTGSEGDGYTLTIHKVGQGAVIPSPAQPTYVAGQAVTLTVIAAAGWQFTGWSGDLSGNANPATVAVVNNHVVTANFTLLNGTSTPTVQATATTVATPRPTAMFTRTFTPTPTPTATNTPVPSPTFTPPPVPTDTPTKTPTDIPTAIPTDTSTPIPTKVPTDTPTDTPTPIPTAKPTEVPTPVNQPPVVDAGANQTITWPAPATLNGTVSDDGLPGGQLVVSWEKVTGPGEVTFAPADAPVTTATFSTPGNYVLILIAEDGALVSHALVAVAVEPPVQIASLNVRVQFEQRDNSAERWQDVPFQVTIKDAAGTQTLYQTAGWVFPAPITDGNYGTATLLLTNPDLIYGQTYQIFIRGAMHLQRRVMVTLTEGMRLDFTDAAVNPDGALWGCDINQDNQVDMADHDIWVAHVQAGATPPPTPDPASSAYRSDINGDHFINISDFSICAANMGKVGD